jgi:hypothetical protein
MPLASYGVLKGTAVDRRLGSGQSPHYQIRVVDDDQDYRIAINVMSALEPSTLEFVVDESFRHPIVEDDGVWQDGGLLFEFPAQNQWVAVFLKFQSQTWHTDDGTGHQLPEAPGGPPSDTGPGEPPGPGTLPTTDQPDGLVRIVGALVNAVSSPEIETVTLLNTSPDPIDLAGWALLDKLKNKQPLTGTIPSGETLRIRVSPPMQLSNKGGIITVVNDDGLRVDGVSYTRDQAQHPGWTVVF